MMCRPDPPPTRAKRGTMRTRTERHPTDESGMTIDRDATADAGAAAPAAAPAPPVPPPGAEARRRPRRRPRAAVLALVLGRLLSCTGTGWARQANRSGAAVDDARRTVTSVAQSYAINLTPYDHATLDRDFTRALDNSTGSFKTQYTQ